MGSCFCYGSDLSLNRIREQSNSVIRYGVASASVSTSKIDETDPLYSDACTVEREIHIFSKTF